MALVQTVHLSMANFKSAPVVPAVQNDTYRQVKMIIDDYTLTSGLTGKIAFERSDGTHYETAAELVLADNAFVADIDQALTQPGRTMVQLKVTDTLTVSSFSFVIFVEADNSGTVTPQEGIDLVTAVAAAEDAADRAESAAEDAEESAESVDAPAIWNAINNITNWEHYTAEQYQIRSQNSVIQENSACRSVVIPVTDGNRYKIVAKGRCNRNKVYGITADSWDIGTTAVDLGYTPEVTTATDNITITIAPTGYKFLLVMFSYSTSDPYPYTFTAEVTEMTQEQFAVNTVEVPTYEQFSPVAAAVVQHNEQIPELYDAIGTETHQLASGYSTASYWSVESTTAEKKTAASYIAWDAIPIVPGTHYSVSIYQGTSSKQDPVIVVDSSYNIIDTYRGTNSQQNSFDVYTENNSAAYVLLTSYGNSSISNTSMTYTSLNDVSEIRDTAERADSATSAVTKTGITTGKYVSILGDSISALAGTIPTGNDAYYTGSNYGITSADDMWWKIVADTLGMNVLVNNSWSGTQVCDRTPGTKIPASYTQRCQALHDSSHNPDYVIIAMGVNDYSYNSYLGDWDGKTMPIDDTDFSQSYALMINRIHSAYPNAIILCIAPWFVQRGNDTGITYCNGTQANPNYTESSYGDVIRKLCDMLGAIYIDSCVGFNKFNYYPTYCEDDSEEPTHPNKTGQAVMGRVIAEKIRTEIF